MELAAERGGGEGSSPRLLLPTERSDLAATWHHHHDTFVLSLWRDGTCVGSARLSPVDAAALAAHIVTQLGGRDLWGPRLLGGAPSPTRRPTPGSVRRRLEGLLVGVRRFLR